MVTRNLLLCRVVLAVTCALLPSACGADATRICHCPSENGFFISVPSDLDSTVKSIEGNGACSGEAIPDGDGQYQLFPQTSGVCHVVVSFQSGTSYTDDVAVSGCTSGCCCQRSYDHDVTVPADAATGAR